MIGQRSVGAHDLQVGRRDPRAQFAGLLPVRHADVGKLVVEALGVTVRAVVGERDGTMATFLRLMA